MVERGDEVNSINIALIACLLWACSKWFMYYCSTRGLIHYLISEYNDCLENEKAKELTSMAVERTIKEFFGK